MIYDSALATFETRPFPMDSDAFHVRRTLGPALQAAIVRSEVEVLDPFSNARRRPAVVVGEVRTRDSDHAVRAEARQKVVGSIGGVLLFRLLPAATAIMATAGALISLTAFVEGQFVIASSSFVIAGMSAFMTYITVNAYASLKRKWRRVIRQQYR